MYTFSLHPPIKSCGGRTTFGKSVVWLEWESNPAYRVQPTVTLRWYGVSHTCLIGDHLSDWTDAYSNVPRLDQINYSHWRKDVCVNPNLIEFRQWDLAVSVVFHGLCQYECACVHRHILPFSKLATAVSLWPEFGFYFVLSRLLSEAVSIPLHEMCEFQIVAFQTAVKINLIWGVCSISEMKRRSIVRTYSRKRHLEDGTYAKVTFGETVGYSNEKWVHVQFASLKSAPHSRNEHCVLHHLFFQSSNSRVSILYSMRQMHRFSQAYGNTHCHNLLAY